MDDQVGETKAAVFVRIEFEEPGSAKIKEFEITNGINPLMLYGLAEVIRQEGTKRMLANEQQMAMRAGLMAGTGVPIPGLKA
jgi:hypothetical protein